MHIAEPIRDLGGPGGTAKNVTKTISNGTGGRKYAFHIFFVTSRSRGCGI